MPRFEVTAPDGQRFEIEAPEGATQEQALSYAQTQFGQQQATPEPSMLDVAGNAAAKGIAGMVDMFGNAPANLLNVGKYVAGDTMEKLGHPIWDDITITPQPNLAQRGMTALGLIRPEHEPQTAGQRILDMAVQAGVGVAASPASSLAGVAKNAALGLTSGAAAGLTKEATGSDVAALAVGSVVPMAAGLAASRANARTLKNPTLKKTLQDAQAAGYVVPPSSVKPSMVTNKLESIGGKAATVQQAAMQNVQTTDRLVAEELNISKHLGLPPDTPVTPEILTQYQNTVIAPYQKVSQLSPLAAKVWERLQNTREEARLSWNEYSGINHPKAALKEARQWQAKEKAYENVLERIAKKSGQPTLMQEVKEARTLYAKSKTAEEAMNLGNGSISATAIGKMLEDGKPLTGNFEIIGRFARAFPNVARDASRIPAAGVSGTEAGMAAMLGTMGYGAAGGPAGLIAAGAPLLRGPARKLLLSKGYQHRLLKESPGLDQAMLKSVLGGRAIAEAP